MEILRELKGIKNVCLGLGFFDGVHLAHKSLIQELVSTSKEKGLNSLILTFKSSPAEVFSSGVKYITTITERENLIAALGVDYLVELDFDKDLSNMSAQDYLEKIIYKNFQPEYIFTGFNHTFGRGKSGNSEYLHLNQRKYGYRYKEIPPVSVDNEIISSTVIKNYLCCGNIEKANILLGYNFKISGEVIKGNQLGREIGFPTANIVYPDNKIQIPFGVYKVSVNINNSIYSCGMMNYGVKPTINNGQNLPVAEVHIIGFNGDIYGENIEIYIDKKIRDEKDFKSIDELKKQIKKDVELC